ncbi:CBS domain-containing protein [Marinobacter sp.]|uniref:CBS domain-containing protein n=1 Tax=Marinobacter sp. TaxID=50741 RepID=UPI0034A546A4
MAIFVSEPGRPVGTRLPEIFRGRRVGDVTEMSESQRINTGHSDVTDAEYQQAGYSSSHQRALEEYGATASVEPREERSYLPVSTLCTPALYSLPAISTIAEALSTMDEHGVHHLVITAQDNVAGLIDLRWLLSWLHAHKANPESQSMTHIELPAFLTASPETDAHQLARLMLAHQLNAALVIDKKGQPTGVVTSTDYLKLYANAGRQQGSV